MFKVMPYVDSRVVRTWFSCVALAAISAQMWQLMKYEKNLWCLWFLSSREHVASKWMNSWMVFCTKVIPTIRAQKGGWTQESSDGDDEGHPRRFGEWETGKEGMDHRLPFHPREGNQESRIVASLFINFPLYVVKWGQFAFAIRLFVNCLPGYECFKQKWKWFLHSAFSLLLLLWSPISASDASLPQPHILSEKSVWSWANLEGPHCHCLYHNNLSCSHGTAVHVQSTYTRALDLLIQLGSNLGNFR